MANVAHLVRATGCGSVGSGFDPHHSPQKEYATVQVVFSFVIVVLMEYEHASSMLKNGGIGILATDTLYGVVGQALNQAAVERIYTVKKRTPTKPFIILISDIADLALFHIVLTPEMKTNLEQYWPGPVSVILECPEQGFAYLHRDTHTLAFRLPAKPELISLIRTTGPLVAPSANPEGLTPAPTIDAARAYFGDTVDFYVSGLVSDKPSKIIKITEDGVEVLRA